MIYLPHTTPITLRMISSMRKNHKKVNPMRNIRLNGSGNAELPERKVPIPEKYANIDIPNASPPHMNPRKFVNALIIGLNKSKDPVIAQYPGIHESHTVTVVFVMVIELFTAFVIVVGDPGIGTPVMRLQNVPITNSVNNMAKNVFVSIIVDYLRV